MQNQKHDHGDKNKSYANFKKISLDKTHKKRVTDIEKRGPEKSSPCIGKRDVYFKPQTDMFIDIAKLRSSYDTVGTKKFGYLIYNIYTSLA